MKSSVEKLSDTRAKLTVEVPFDELTVETDNAYKVIAKEVSVPGFRRGKAPRQIIDTRVGRAVVLEQIVQDMLPTRYEAAVKEHELVVLGSPTIDVSELKDREYITFTAEVDVRPTIELPDFKSYELEVAPLRDVEEVVDEEIEQLRERFATVVPVDRPSEEKDLLDFTIEILIDGEPCEVESLEDSIECGAKHDEIDGVDEALKGVTVDDVVTLECDPANFGITAEEGKKYEAKITVTKISERVLPEVDDTFAEESSPFDTVDELKETIRNQAKERVAADQAADIRDAVLKQALESSEFELPESLVAEQVEASKNNILNQLAGDMNLFKRLLESQGSSYEEFEADARKSAEKAIRTQLFLDRLADEVKPTVEQSELQDHIVFTAQSYGMDPATFLKQLQASGQVANLFSDVRRGKALASVICDVKVKDTDGNEVNPSTYFGEEEVSPKFSDAELRGKAAE